MKIIKKQDRKLFVVFVVLVIIIFSTFAAAIYYYDWKSESQTKEKISPLFVKIFANETSGMTPFAVNFRPLVLFWEGDVKYEWDFGDNETSDEMNPIHTYENNGSFICTLEVTDGTGQESSDSVEITARANQPPSVSIVISEIVASRPYIPLLSKVLKTDIYGSRVIRQLLELNLIPSSLLGIKSDVFCDAQVLDPEGDEIVSYTWELRAPTYVTKLGKQVKPVYSFKEKSVTFPLLYIYPKATYDLTLIVTDAAGNKGSDNIKFRIEESGIESQISTAQHSIKRFRDTLRDRLWHDILKPDLGDDAERLILEKIFPALPDLPWLKIFIIIKLINWGIDLKPVILDVMTEFLEKHPDLKPLVKETLEMVQLRLEKMKDKYPQLASTIDGLIDSIQQILEGLGLANKSPVLSDEDPKHGSELINPNYPEVSITVTDRENDTFNISIHGDYVNDVYLTNQYSNTFNATLITPLPFETDIYWHVNVSDAQGRWVNNTYMFTTRWS